MPRFRFVSRWILQAILTSQCPSPHILQVELDALSAVLEVGEREDTWEKQERAIIRFTAVTRGGGYKHLPLFVDGVGRKGAGMGLATCVGDVPSTVAPR